VHQGFPIFFFLDFISVKIRWRYAQEHNVQLPDEYDSIWRDLEPFWGIDPVNLLQLQAAQETRTDSFTLAKNETGGYTNLDKVAFSDPDTWQQRALLRGVDEILDLLEPIDEYLPPFRAVFSPHDNPNLLSDYHVKKVTLEAAAAGKCALGFYLSMQAILTTP
jgi:hypothetical protein